MEFNVFGWITKVVYIYIYIVEVSWQWQQWKSEKAETENYLITMASRLFAFSKNNSELVKQFAHYDWYTFCFVLSALVKE